MDYPAGTTANLTDTVSVVIGSITTVDSHPSGAPFDGPAVIVSAYINAFGIPIVGVVSLADATARVILTSSY
jgi:hypothetical protein